MMTVEDLLEELKDTPPDQLDYSIRVNVGDESSGDIWVNIDELEWDHENRVIKIHEEGYGDR